MPSTSDGSRMIDGRYRLVRQLGSGAHGRVFEAEDVFLERRVALKFLPPLKTRAELAAVATEAKALASVVHKHVPRVHSFGPDLNAPYFVMELIEGESLSAVISDHCAHDATVPLTLALRIADAVASALGAAHAAGLLHRDVKPDNVMIERNTGRPVLVDFGGSRQLSEVSEFTTGTLSYMANEVRAGDPASIASDVYSLGCLVYELITGLLPGDGLSLEEVLRVRDEEEEVTADAISARALAPVVDRALAADPRERFSTCAAFRAALRNSSQAVSAHDSGLVQLLPAHQDAIRILVVDDDPVFARLAQRAATVAFAGIEVAVSRAPTGESALANAKKWNPELLMLDYHLPGIDGVEVLSRIRALPGGSQVSVVVMSGDVGTPSGRPGGARWRFSSLGVQRFLQKPVAFVDLVQEILELAQQHGWVPRARLTAP